MTPAVVHAPEYIKRVSSDYCTCTRYSMHETAERLRYAQTTMSGLFCCVFHVNGLWRVADIGLRQVTTVQLKEIIISNYGSSEPKSSQVCVGHENECFKCEVHELCSISSCQDFSFQNMNDEYSSLIV